MRTSRLVLKHIDASLPLSATSQAKTKKRHAAGIAGLPFSATMWTPHLVLKHNRHSLTIFCDAPLLDFQAQKQRKVSLLASPGHLSSAVMRSSHLVLTTIDTSSPLWRNSAFGSSVGHASKTFLLLTLASDFSHDFLFASDPSGSENLDKTIVSTANYILHLPSP
ncbi:hypothetical protein TNCT_166711 [Trichonephila clavata]|uniref:Uncharacterized protein n=1 Tax=Trichonephila clavata TaxID=2740835 RepID=A0A8X6L7N5_TRICU|nr:hypothetical protein TNCT_166711 [Trichonephila clavata]